MTQLMGTFNPAVFDDYIPYVGATDDVYLGTRNLLTSGTLGAGATTVTTLNATTSLTVVSLNGMLKASSGLVSADTFGTNTYVPYANGAGFSYTAGFNYASSILTVPNLTVTTTTTLATSLSGLLKGTSGVVSAITDNSATWNAAQAGDATLTALAGFDSSAGFLKQTAADTFSKDTFGTQYYIPVSTGTGFSYNAALVSDTSYNLIGTGYARFDGGLGVGAAPGTNFIINLQPTLNSAIFKGINLVATTTRSSGAVTFARGQDFSVVWKPAATSSDRTCSSLQGGVATAKVDTTDVITNNNIVVSNAACMIASILTSKGASHTGNLTVTTASCYNASIPGVVADSVVTNNFAFYDSGQYVDGTKTPNSWGIGINTPNNYINGSLSVGKATAPTAGIDSANDTTTVTSLKATKNVATVSADIAPADFVQDSTTGACEVLRLQQDDTSEEFIDFVGTDGGATGADSGKSIIVALSGTKYKLKLYAVS